MDDEMRYRKKSKKHGLKRSNHKHDYHPCVYEFNGVTYDSTYGFVPKKDIILGQYCIICGRIKLVTPENYKDFSASNLFQDKYNFLGNKEINPETRTIPTFWIDDIWKQKFVDLDRTASR